MMQTLVAFLMCWFVTSSMWIYPHSLSYFNESIGGPRNGPEHLLGSNVDWGQDLRYLTATAEQLAAQRIVVDSNLPIIDPQHVGLDWLLHPGSSQAAPKAVVVCFIGSSLPESSKVTEETLRRLLRNASRPHVEIKRICYGAAIYTVNSSLLDCDL